MPKTYPAYFGSYDRFNHLQSWIDQFENLFLIGRNGMHRYNNMDHSMLTAMVAVDNILRGRADKSNIWAVNTDQEYHEVRQERPAMERTTAAKHVVIPADDSSTTPRQLVLPSGEKAAEAETYTD
jgi:hypothetical protein